MTRKDVSNNLGSKMEYNSETSCPGRLNDLEDAENLSQAKRAEIQTKNLVTATIPCSQALWYSSETPISRNLPIVAKRSLSTQVMEYYHKYSQNSSLGRYFSLPEPGVSSEGTNYHGRGYGPIPETCAMHESYIVIAAEERSRLESSMPRERRRWARPPLIGQPSDGPVTASYASSMDSRTPSPITKHPITETIPEERSESREVIAESKENEAKPSISSPTSSVKSNKLLEWDSGADVGYFNALPPSKEKDKKLCTIERMALSRGCSAAMRLDPEGTNESSNQKSNSRASMRISMKPNANSTPLAFHVSGESESEIEITPVMKKTHVLPGIIVESDMKNQAGNGASNREEPEKPNEASSSAPVKYPTEGSRSKDSRQPSPLSPLKKSSSMNLLAFPMSRLSLKRSQSELNLRGKEKRGPPVIFDSTSSLATVVNRPSTCDKLVQTSLDDLSRESIGIQVDEEKATPGEKNAKGAEEEKPPLPKRASSLGKSLHSILKNSSNTYNVRARTVAKSAENDRLRPEESQSESKEEKELEEEEEEGRSSLRHRGGGGNRNSERNSSSEPSRNESSIKGSSRNESSTRSEIPAEDTATEEGGRASNSFEYFPGHIYQNVPNGSSSQVSSIDTGRESRGSTMPNTSSSIDEKLWGDSDSLVRDLEKSVNILKSLVDANKCDKQVKKRLIHHVIKRLVTAKYTDDVIEHELEENVPWNPADTRDKVYRNDIIQALTNKQNTTDSSGDDWRPRKRNLTRGMTSSPKKNLSKVAMAEIIDLAASSRASTVNSDKFAFDRHTDRTVMDGRKARMGLRSEDHRRETDAEKSESSECFLPSHQHKVKSTNVFYSIDDRKRKEKSRESPSRIVPAIPSNPITTAIAATTTTTNTTSATSPSHTNQMSNGIILVKERNELNETDWRLPTTMSERRFELGRCSNSESGDTKLIHYAEAEKRNQLVWITNEISHLCNLKRLLESSSGKGEKSRGGNSTRKRLTELPVGSWVAHSHDDRNASSRAERARGVGSEIAADEPLTNDSMDKGLENHWSSHGNLANVCSEKQRSTKRREKDRVGPTRMRNSCTQTGSDGERSGHSKTGGEIVSVAFPVLGSIQYASINRETRREMRNASVQTRRSSSPEKTVNIVTTIAQISEDPATRREHLSTCPTRVQSQSNGEQRPTTAQNRHVCYCQRYAIHSRHRACMIHSAQIHSREHSKDCPRRSVLKGDERPIISQPIADKIPPSRGKDVDSRKEAKNQMNATCKSNYAVHKLSRKKPDLCDRCEKVPRPEVTTETLKEAPKSSKSREFVEICHCDVGPSTESEASIEKVDESTESSSETGSSSENEIQPRENAPPMPECTCHIEEMHSSDRDSAAEGRQKIQRQEPKVTNTEKIHKSCRTCGTVWQFKDSKYANRRCKCSQNYLKPVAYELKFDEAGEEKSRNNREKRGIEKTGKVDKTGKKRSSAKTQTKATQSLPMIDKSSTNSIQPEENNQHEDEHPSTLKDFLAVNRPEFLENVETRRRYMSEISQLRQLKREKRKQFLAMAGNSAFLKPQRPVKNTTASPQRKISENEMKLRLRMRYLRLNEVRNKRRQLEKEEDAKRNHLMAKLFGQKLQQKVLKGQVDLSQSVSVISNL